MGSLVSERMSKYVRESLQEERNGGQRASKRARVKGVKE